MIHSFVLIKKVITTYSLVKNYDINTEASTVYIFDIKLSEKRYTRLPSFKKKIANNIRSC